MQLPGIDSASVRQSLPSCEKRLGTGSRMVGGWMSPTPCVSPEVIAK